MLALSGRVPWVVVGLLLGPLATAQQFTDETEARFPTPNPKEYSYQVTLGDVDVDGDLDLVFANANAFDKPAVDAPAHQSRLFVNDGGGVFADESDSRLGIGPGWYRDVELADLDGDDAPDLIFAGAFGHGPAVLMNDGSGVFTDETAGRAPEYDGFWGSGVAAGDVDMDGDLDLYLTNAGSKMYAPPGGQDRLWINNGAGLFTDETTARLPDLVTRATVGVAFADIDNDQDLDIVVCNRDIKSNLLLNDGTGHFANGSFLLVADGKDSRAIRPGDLNGDGLLDLLVVNGSKTSTTRELIMVNSVTSSSQGFVDATDLFLAGAGTNPKADDNDLELVDFDMDGDLDVLIAALSPGEERALLNDGNGFLTVADDIVQKSGDATLDLEVGDLDGDQRLDMVTAQGESGNFENRVYISAGPVDSQAPIIGNVGAGGPTGAYVGPVPIVARVVDGATTDGAPRVASVLLGADPMRWAGGTLFRGVLATGLIKAPFTVVITAVDAAGNEATSAPVEIAPRHPLDVFADGVADDKDLQLMIDHLVDNGGLGDEGDMNGDGQVDLTDAQLLASGLGGSPVLSRAVERADGSFLLIGANFDAGPTVSAEGANFTVVDFGPVSILATTDAPPSGAFVVSSGGASSNALPVGGP